MNIHFQQAEKKPQVFFYILVTLAVLSASMVLLSVGQRAAFHLSVPVSSRQVAIMEDSNLPIAVSAPMPPAEQLLVKTMPMPSATPSPLPQAVPVPVPDLP